MCSTCICGGGRWTRRTERPFVTASTRPLGDDHERPVYLCLLYVPLPVIFTSARRGVSNVSTVETL